MTFCGIWGSNAGHQACPSSPFPAAPSHQPGFWCLKTGFFYVVLAALKLFVAHASLQLVTILLPQPPMQWVLRLWLQRSVKRRGTDIALFLFLQGLARGEAYRPVLLRRRGDNPGLQWSGLLRLGEHLR